MSSVCVGYWPLYGTIYVIHCMLMWICPCWCQPTIDMPFTFFFPHSPSLKNALSTPTATDRLKLLSPAARKLAQKATPTRSVDQSLRSSYTPSHTPSASPLVRSQAGSTHRRRNDASTPSVSTQGNEARGSRTPSTPLLSDNLLQLNK